MNVQQPSQGGATIAVVVNDTGSCGNPSCRAPKPKHKCARCLSIFYCSKECQLSHYPDHKSACKEIARRYCQVEAPCLLGYDANDVGDMAILQRIEALSREYVPVDSDDKMARTLPLLVPHKPGEAVTNASGEYKGVPVPAEVLHSMLTDGLDSDDDDLYRVPLNCGLALMAVAAGHSPRLYVPSIVAIKLPRHSDIPTLPGGSRIKSIQSLITWRQQSLAKKRDAAVKMEQKANRMERASLVQELLFLFDKHVFPTIQLMRAAEERGALIIRADDDTLQWEFVTGSDVHDVGGDYLSRYVESHDPSSSIVTLTGGSCVWGSGNQVSDPSQSVNTNPEMPVVILLPIHVAQAFHTQQVNARVRSAVGVRCKADDVTHALQELQRRQHAKARSMSDCDESEA